MRMLKSTDIFPMVQILNKIGFSEIRDIITPEKLTGLLSDDKDQEDSVDLSTILGFNLIFDMIAPFHGAIWRENPLQIVEKSHRRERYPL